MTRRTREHVIADQAVAAVRRIWNKQGAAVDEIHKDYGEDLYVKTCIRGRVDPKPIWVQVKGTERDCMNETKKLPSVKLGVRQLIRWSRFQELVVVVLWDVSNDVGWYSIPDDHGFDYANLLDSGTAHVSLNFSRDDKFDVAAADLLAWDARLAAANRLLESQRARESLIEDSAGEEGNELTQRIQGEMGLQLTDIMYDLGLVRREGEGGRLTTLDSTFHDTLVDALETNLRSQEEYKEFGSFSRAVDAAIASTLLTGLSMPPQARMPVRLFYEMVYLIKLMKFENVPRFWDNSVQ
ncbi:DUF4365 domain-containing protein [Saccharopolyspora aridisoli]|uniref:DUF4365 domain-containing protein n=1 Tax=Saccharopolyspora aridisoli TaxID=2530385 RepID=UPI0014055A7E|nr:DUF4365 domain-containing protein [Saccharopolyspora aridisoli]